MNLTGWQKKTARFEIGEKVHCPNVGRNGVILNRHRSNFGGLRYLVEVDEPYPFVGRNNPRRAIWTHERHIEKSLENGQRD